jgi:hypothetical protein
MRILTACLLCAAAVASGATMTGWISDASCGVANAKGDAEARECAKSCIKNGSAPVFVSDADQKVYKLAGKDVKAHMDYKVKVTGDVKGGTITVQDIRKAD